MSTPPDRPAAETERGSPRPGRTRLDALAALSFVAGPLALLVDLSGSQVLAPQGHGTESMAGMHALTLLAMVIVGAGAGAAVRVLRAPAAGAMGGHGVAKRSRLLAMGGLFLCAFFLGVVIARAIPRLLLSPRG